MKFRYKVLMINLILLSLSLGTAGYLMIHKNFVLARETQLQNAIMQNNLLQSSVEYELLQMLNSDGGSVKGELPEIGERIASSMGTNVSFYIRYGENFVYSSDENQQFVPEELFSEPEMEGKNYVITKEKGRQYIYVISISQVQEERLCIISRSDAAEAYSLMQEQIKYFRLTLVTMLLICSVVMYVVSVYLTRPLEQLNKITEKIAEGNYEIRAEVHTGDEIALLAEKFNTMAEAVEEHVEELNDMLHRREQFVADFTHEIKTPMTTIIGYADTMRSMELPREEQIMALSYIFSEGKRLEEMSGKLFALIYLRQHTIEKSPIHAADMVQEIARIVSPVLEQKKLKLVTDAEPAVIQGSRELLVTAFVNLIDNARKASGQGQSIEFTGKSMTEGGKVCYELMVSDHGIGMTSEETQKICNEFYMADKSRARKEGGAGIGMSLVALILEHHGAQLLIESSPGKGTRIRVRFQKEG